MCFLTFWGGVFGCGGVGFPLASAHAGAKADVEKMTKSIGFYGVICLCALCARMAQSKGRERKTKKIRALKRKKNAHRGHPQNHIKNTILGAKMAPKIDPGTLCFALGARFPARSTPRRVQERSWELPGGNKKL